MYCKNCGKEIKDSAKFCPYCGMSESPAQADMLKEVSLENAGTPRGCNPPHKGGRENKRAIIAIIVVAVLLCGGLFSWQALVKTDAGDYEWELAHSFNGFQELIFPSPADTYSVRITIAVAAPYGDGLDTLVSEIEVF
jgi:hypothetical protein